MTVRSQPPHITLETQPAQLREDKAANLEGAVRTPSRGPLSLHHQNGLQGCPDPSQGTHAPLGREAR